MALGRAQPHHSPSAKPDPGCAGSDGPTARLAGKLRFSPKPTDVPQATAPSAERAAAEGEHLPGRFP